jgi:hypothetical protein
VLVSCTEVISRASGSVQEAGRALEAPLVPEVQQAVARQAPEVQQVPEARRMPAPSAHPYRV